jgi:hypothetical protein
MPSAARVTFSGVFVALFNDHGMLGVIFKRRHHSFRRFAECEEGENVQSDRRGKKQQVQPGTLRKNVTRYKNQVKLL